MSRKQSPAIIIVLLAFGPVSAEDKEPEVRGRKLSEWVKLVREDPELDRRRAALFVIDSLGSKSRQVLPVLIKEVRDNSEPQIRARCAELLPKYKSQSEKLVELLAAVMRQDKSEKVRAAAAAAVAKFDRDGFPAIPALIETLKDGDAGTRMNAAETLARFSLIDPVIARDAAPNLVACLKDKDAEVRFAAAHTLGRMSALSEPAISDLAALTVSDPAAKVRREAAKTLAGLGPKADSAVPVLVKALSDADPEVRVQVLLTLGRIGDRAGAALPDLLKAIKDKDRIVRAEAIHAIGRLGKAGHSAIPDLVRILKDEQVPDVRLAAIQELGEFGPEAKPAIEALTIATRDGRAAIREAAGEALKKIQKPSN